MADEKSIKIKKNDLWKYATFVLLAIVIILGVISFKGGCTGQVISENEAGANLVNFLSSAGYSGFEILNVEDLGTMYKVNTDYQGGEVPFYITKDGKYLVNGELVSIIPEPQQTDPNSQTDIPKSAKPVVELFIMSYCPYGTQAEKGIIPVAELLENKIDFRIRYVYYAMHGEKEITENLREYCIQENEPEKFLDYMTCFLEGDGVESDGYITNGNDINTCLAQAEIDTTTLGTCMTEADSEFSVTKNLEDESSWLSGYYPLFDVDKELNEKYGIGGSPTLVINGKQVSSSRDPASYLDTVCQAFTNPPTGCSEVLSSQIPSAYFGWEGTSSTSAGQC